MDLSQPDPDAEGIGYHFAVMLAGSATTLNQGELHIQGIQVLPGDEVKVLHVTEPTPQDNRGILLEAKGKQFRVSGQQFFNYFCESNFGHAEGEQPDHGGH